VRLAALDLEGISWGDLGGLGSESVVSENLRFSSKIHEFLTFHSMSPSV